MKKKLRRLNVSLGGKALGTIAETPDRKLFFEYTSSWLKEGFSISPYHLPLTPGLKREPTGTFEGLFGVFDDSLPDGWGRLLTDRFFRQQGRTPETLSPLDRLACVGRHGMGALEYEPVAEGAAPGQLAIDLDEIATQAERIANGSPEEVLPALRVAGGSSGGSRPKAFVAYNPSTGEMASDPSSSAEGFEHWLVKFRAKEDPADAGAIEAAYAVLARTAGIDIPCTRIFTTSSGRYFGIQRFDWQAHGVRVHTHSFGGLIHSNFRFPNRDYREFLSIAFDVTKDFRQVEQAFRRAVFNVLAHNRDDHVKNFAFVFNPSSGWRLAPAYDLTWSHGVRGEHNMTVMGSGNPSAKELLALAQDAGIDKRSAAETIEAVRAAIADWRRVARQFEVSNESITELQKALPSLK
ncbi:MAG: type II toxin-antitoxin system HipA family toxin [Opitutaceae bacterium]